VRRRDSDDRRAVRVELTRAGEARHAQLREAVITFDRRLRADLTSEEVGELRQLLGKLEANVSPSRDVRSA
jgi:DNA-binding MarR family transcriptional regulator